MKRSIQSSHLSSSLQKEGSLQHQKRGLVPQVRLHHHRLRRRARDKRVNCGSSANWPPFPSQRTKSPTLFRSHSRSPRTDTQNKVEQTHVQHITLLQSNQPERKPPQTCDKMAERRVVWTPTDLNRSATGARNEGDETAFR